MNNINKKRLNLAIESSLFGAKNGTILLSLAVVCFAFAHNQRTTAPKTASLHLPPAALVGFAVKNMVDSLTSVRDSPCFFRQSPSLYLAPRAVGLCPVLAPIFFRETNGLPYVD